jgi:hypothetical protein
VEYDAVQLLELEEPVPAHGRILRGDLLHRPAQADSGTRIFETLWRRAATTF